MSPQPPSAIMTFRPVGFSSLAGWAADDHGAALAAFVRTCGKILAKDPALPLDSTTGAASAYGTAADWQALHAEPARGDLAFRYGISVHLSDRSLHERELANWLTHRVGASIAPAYREAGATAA